MSDLPSKTFCALPWMHLSTRPNGLIRVCCTANASGVLNPESHKKTRPEQLALGGAGLVRNDDGMPANANNSSIVEAWNNTYMRETRKLMMEGKEPPSCLKCFQEEKAGVRSKRIWETNKWIDQIGLEDILQDYNYDTGEVPPKIRYIDLRFGNNCQLACVMCSPNDSSGWIKEHKKIAPNLKNEVLQYIMQWDKENGELEDTGGAYNWHKNNPEFFKDLYNQIPYLKQLYFAGGEPLIHKEHYEILQRVIDMGYADQIELRYNSNGIEWQDNLFDLWKKFKNVIFHFSIDDVDDRLHFIRYPADFSHLENQIRLLDDYQHGNLKLTTAYTVLALNIRNIPAFVKWKLRSNFKLLNKWPDGAGMFNCHLAYWPPQLNVKALPDWYKNEVEEDLDELCEWLEENWQLSGAPDKESFINSQYGISRIKGLVKFMKAEDWTVRLPEMAEWCYTVARERNQNFNEIFPELDWLEWYLNAE